MLILCIELPLILINLLYLVPVWAAVNILDGDVNWWWKKDGGNSLIYFYFYFLYDLVGKSWQNIVLELSDLAAHGWKWICLTWRISEPLVRGGCEMACMEMWMRNWAEASWSFGNCQVWKTETNAECLSSKEKGWTENRSWRDMTSVDVFKKIQELQHKKTEWDFSAIEEGKEDTLSQQMTTSSSKWIHCTDIKMIFNGNRRN